MPTAMESKVLSTLGTIKIRDTLTESEIHSVIAKAFDNNDIHYRHEYRLVPRKRVDFWISGIVVEVKKEKPPKVAMLEQMSRYLKIPEVQSIIIVLEKSMDLPASLYEKPIYVVSLNANWGIAL